ncbi:hypothetical protein EB001_20255, partial [bacterium]|nr:hypothetical protein [bacterium]
HWRWQNMSGKKSKVIQFPKATAKKIDSASSKGTITERFPSLKENRYWIELTGSLIGTTIMFTLFYLVGKAIYE